MKLARSTSYDEPEVAALFLLAHCAAIQVGVAMQPSSG